MSESQLEFRVDEALLMMTGALRGSHARLKTIQAPTAPTDLRTGAFLVAAAIPPAIPFVFARRPSPEELRKLLPKSTKVDEPAQEQSLKSVYVPYDTSTIQAPPPLSPEKRKALFNKVKENIPPGNSQMICVPAPYYEGNLPSINATVTISAIDAELSDPTESLANATMLYDTGAEMTVISDGILSPEFRQSLRSEANKPYISPANFVQVSARICFTNSVLALDTIAIVRPGDRMPNGFNGIILGQKAAIDCLVAKMVPRHFLKHSPENFWGEIHITQAYDIFTEEITEYK